MAGPVNQPDYLDGVLIYVGGPEGPESNDEIVAVHLREDGTIYTCTTLVQTAGKLASYLQKQPIRVFGAASWIRDEAAGWTLQRFFVEDFAPLEDKPLREALAELEELPSPDWPEWNE